MEFLKNVLIKEADGSKLGDKVFFVDNLPKSLLFHKVAKRMIDYTNPQQNLVPEFVMNEKGVKQLTGAMVDELLPGIEMSQTGDGGFVFFTQYNEALYRLRDIDNYIKANTPVLERIPVRIPYAIQPGVMSSGTRPLSELPRVVLPEPVSPPSNDVQVSAAQPGTTLEVVKRPRKELSPEAKKAAADRLAKARLVKQQKYAIKE